MPRQQRECFHSFGRVDQSKMVNLQEGELFSGSKAEDLHRKQR